MTTSTAPAGAIIATGPNGLLPHHLRELREGSGLSDATIIANGIKSEENRDRLKSLLKRKGGMKNAAPAIVFPFTAADGTNGYCRVKPDCPRVSRGSRVKYESPIGEPNRIYIPAGVADYLKNPKQELLITEGEKKALKLTQEGFPCIGLVGVFGWKEKDHERLIGELEQITWPGRETYVVFDSDLERKPDVQGAESRLAAQLIARGAKARCVRLPDGAADDKGEPTKQGADDALVAWGADAKRNMRALLDSAIDPLPVEPDSAKQNASNLDPAKEARAFRETGKYDGCDRLRNWRGLFQLWTNGSYTEAPPGEVRAHINNFLDQNYHHLTTGITGNVLDQLKAQSLLSFGYSPPCWLDVVKGCEDWLPAELVTARNGIIHLPSLDTGKRYIVPATPRFFTTAALDYDYDHDAPEPAAWLSFLGELFAGDPDSILTLQQWFGLCLVADTRFQKMLLLVGPKRSGKGTVARVLRSVVGPHNCAGPTLASLAQNFGLQPLVGKTVAIFSDARLSGRTDQAVVTERLLSITGEDDLTIDMKHRDPVTCKLNTRLMMLTNELPRLGDSSGALSGRMIVLRLLRSFYGREDIDLTNKLLAERSGILRWATRGWRLLHDQGCFIQPASGEALREQMDDLSSPVGAFLKERCIVGPGHRVSVQSLYAAWAAWCVGKGRKTESEQMFGRDLAAVLPDVRLVRQREGEARFRSYEGIGLVIESPEGGF